MCLADQASKSGHGLVKYPIWPFDPKIPRNRISNMTFRDPNWSNRSAFANPDSGSFRPNRMEIRIYPQIPTLATQSWIRHLKGWRGVGCVSRLINSITKNILPKKKRIRTENFLELKLKFFKKRIWNNWNKFLILEENTYLNWKCVKLAGDHVFSACVPERLQVFHRYRAPEAAAKKTLRFGNLNSNNVPPKWVRNPIWIQTAFMAQAEIWI